MAAPWRSRLGWGRRFHSVPRYSNDIGADLELTIDDMLAAVRDDAQEAVKKEQRLEVAAGGR